MNIDKEKIERIIEELSNPSEDVMRVVHKLKSLIEPEKWEPKEYEGDIYQMMGDGTFCKDRSFDSYRLHGSEWPTKELATIARDMNKRNQLILQAKHEKGYGDGIYYLYYHCVSEDWCVVSDGNTSNPELTLETNEQAERIIELLQLNANSK